MEVGTLNVTDDSAHENAYTAFKTQLRSLCLDDFPCSMGSWRDSITVPSKANKRRLITVDKDAVESKFSVTLKDYPVQTEKVDQLTALVRSPHSLWNMDYSWSGEARQLRETAVKSPWLVDDRYVHDNFRSLKIIDKNVNDVDRDMLRFRNLEELTLSANYLQQVPSENLPSKLKVLELCGNQIEDLSTLCHRPPPLIHLGLGHNQLTVTDDYITGEMWPHLVSLDLSYNHLTDLLELISRLNSLPQLRNLILMGNPLFLLPGYRGFVVDSLRLLQILDDVRITADEKHNFKGLAKNKDNILEEVKIKLAVEYIKGLPIPEEVKNPADQPEFPIINRKYYVEFMFPRGSPTDDVIDLGADDTVSVVTSRTADQTVASQDGDGAVTRSPSQATVSTQHQIPGIEEDEEMEKPESELVPTRSECLPYSEELELNWSKVFTRNMLTLIRDFCKQGLQLRVMEEKILSYPADQMSGTPDPKKKKDKKDEKKAKPEEKKDDKGKKKKKELDIELHHLPAEFTTHAEFHLPLEDFLEGESFVEKNFVHEEIEASPRCDSTEPEKKKLGKKDKPPSALKKKDSKTDKGRRDSVKTGKAKVDKAIDEEESAPPPPLEVKVSVKLIRYLTAAEVLKSNQTSPTPADQ